MHILKRKTLKDGYARREISQSVFLPYEGHWDSQTVITKKREFVMVIKVEGFSFETADDEDVDIKKRIRNTLFKSVGAGDVAMWFHTVRRKHKAHIEGEYENGFCDYLDDLWEEKHSGEESFINEMYISVVTKTDTEGTAANISETFNRVLKKIDSEQINFEMTKKSRILKELTLRLAGSLREYKTTVLGLRETEQGVFSEVLEFLGMIVNCGEYTPMLVPTNDVASYLSTSRLYFGSTAVEMRKPDGTKKFAAAVSVKEYAPHTNSGMLDAFLQLPFEFIITQSFTFTNRQLAISKMSLHQQRMESAGDKAVSQMMELTDAMDMASGGHIAFGDHHLSIFIMDDDIDRLEKAASFCYGNLIDSGIIPSREYMNLQCVYWAQLPGNFEYTVRASTINTLNLSSFVSFHNYPVGKANDNHWGPAVTVFDTTSGTPYYFNFHVHDVGHTTIIGPTGAGKTVLMNFLMAQAQKFNANMFFFDKDRGAEIFIRAIGGIYNIIQPMQNSGFNPLQLPENPDNIVFMKEWVRALCLATINNPITPDENDLITEAVKGNFKIPVDKRKLGNVVPFLGLEGPGTLAGRMKIWHSGDSHSGLFDNDIDTLDFNKAKVFGFEMGKVLEDGLSLGPTLLYLFHKISISLDGTPTIIVLDEAWALIDNEIFAPKIKDWLKVLRKLNAMVVMATQSVEDASKSAISDTLLQQTSTQIFLPNQKATDEYKRAFLLSDREFTLIKSTDPGTRYFLVKQANDVVVARIDLSGMDDVINVLSGRADTVVVMDKIIEEVGDDPDDWLPIFFERTRGM